MSFLKSLLRSCSVSVVRVKTQAENNFLGEAVTKANIFQAKIIPKWFQKALKSRIFEYSFGKFSRRAASGPLG